MGKKQYKQRKNKLAEVKKETTAHKKTSRKKVIPKYGIFGKQEWINSIVFIALAFILYYASLSFGYILDDTIVIVDNTFTQKGFSGLVDIFSTESFAGYFGEQKNLVQGARYRPLSIATFAIEQQFFGSNPGVSHFINILLYGLTGIALYYLLNQFYNSSKSHRLWNIAFVTALIYIAHPIHTEAIANIKGRDEIMTMLFALCSMIAVAKWDQNNKVKYGIYSGLLFFLALLAKENAITLCAVIPVAMYIFRKKTVFQSLKFAIPIIIATGIYLAIRYSVIGYFLNSGTQITDLMNNPFVEMNQGEKYATISFTLWKYLSLSIFPHPLAHDYYPYAIPKLNWTDMRALLPALLYLIMGIWSVIVIIKRKKQWFGLIFFLVTLTIVSNVFVNVGTFMNERFIYMASAGICLLLSIFLVQFLGNKSFRYAKYLAMGLTGVIILGYCTKTMSRVPDWKDTISLNKSAVKVNPGSARANSFMSTALYNAYKDRTSSEERTQQMLLAGYYADQAIKVHPSYKNANLMRAGVAAELYKYDQEIPKLLKTFKEVIERRPDIPYLKQYLQYLNENLPSRELEDFYYEVGYEILFQKHRQVGWAIQYLLLGYDHYPQSPKILQALAEAYQAIGNTTESQKYQNLIVQ